MVLNPRAVNEMTMTERILGMVSNGYIYSRMFTYSKTLA